MNKPINFEDSFHPASIDRARDYVRLGLVRSVTVASKQTLISEVANPRGRVYQQHIEFVIRGTRLVVDGDCSCPVGHNCKHIAAVILSRFDRNSPQTARSAAREPQGPLSPITRHWLERVTELKDQSVHAPAVPARSEDYPERANDRLLYVLDRRRGQLGIELYKGRMNAAGTALNKTMRRYNPDTMLRDPYMAPQFLRPVDLEIVPQLIRIGMITNAHRVSPEALAHLYGAPIDAVTLLRRLGQTGRLLAEEDPAQVLSWDTAQLEPQLSWVMRADGSQKLIFRAPDANDGDGALELMSLGQTTLWHMPHRNLIGQASRHIEEALRHLVASGPAIGPQEAAHLATTLPDRIGKVPLPSPETVQSIHRTPHTRKARLHLHSIMARQARHRQFPVTTRLPALTLRFAYDGHDTPPGETPRFMEGNALVTLEPDSDWEQACLDCLHAAGAVETGELEIHRLDPSAAQCDFVFADDEYSAALESMTALEDALPFAMRLVSHLRTEGWEVEIAADWPYQPVEAQPQITVQTKGGDGAAFQGHDWFSLGFQVEIDGKTQDLAPLVAAFLEQIGSEFDPEAPPDLDTLRRWLEAQPIYLRWHGKQYAALDLSPLAPVLHLFLRYYGELETLHPGEAMLAADIDDALDGSTVRFADNAGILPLAESLKALQATRTFLAPQALKGELRDYQAFGAAWMGSLIDAGFGGVLADDMGLGKTVQILALLLARREAGKCGPTLLIVPTSLLHSWRAQATQFTPDLELLILHGPQRKALMERVDTADLVITTYPLLARDRARLAAREWDLVILDEAQTLKNPAAQMAKALRDIPAAGRLALTGTPLENSLRDLWTLFDWAVPGLLGDRKTFLRVFQTPIEKHADAAAQARLNRRLRPFLLRRTKEEVASELPPRTEIMEHVTLPKAQQELYETVRSAMDVRVRDAISKRGMAAARITILDALLKLRQVCCDPSLVKMKAARNVADSAKRARLRELVGELVAEGRRVLIFSQFVEMLKLIAADLEQMKIAHLALTGQTRDRAGVLEAFARGDAPVFLLSLQAGGVGLTLTEADTVILFDPWWNPAVERQAMDRTHRIGQDKPVFVHRLIAGGTVEEKIQELQKRKQALADALFDDEGANQAALLDEAALQDLFAPLEP